MCMYGQLKLISLTFTSSFLHVCVLQNFVSVLLIVYEIFFYLFLNAFSAWMIFLHDSEDYLQNVLTVYKAVLFLSCSENTLFKSLFFLSVWTNLCNLKLTKFSNYLSTFILFSRKGSYGILNIFSAQNFCWLKRASSILELARFN